jgi:UPF0755 protein
MNYYYQDTPKRRNRHKNKHTKLILPIVAIIIFTLIIKSCSTPKTEDINFLISPGESLNSVSERLEDKEIISSPFFFKRYLATRNLDTKIQAGSFNLPTNSSSAQIAEILIDSSQSNRMKITIPEGYKISQIDNTLTQLNLIQSGDFTDCTKTCNISHPILQHIPIETNSMEGFLYPDTYFVDPASFTSQKLITDMLNNFEKKLPTDWQQKISNTPAKNLYEVIIMSSIVEREVLSPTDKANVAHILWKRLENDWRIDADAALLYDQADNIITQSDLQSNSPYNLRKFKGLTPTPISNPSQETIQATLNPISNNYWFYLTTLDTGKVIYAETLDQHNSNVQKYLR